MTLMTAVIPSLEAIKKEGEQGRRQINQYTRYLTVFLATMQGYFIAVSLQNSGGNWRRYSGCVQSGYILLADDSGHACRGRHVPALAWRANYCARRWQWRLTDYFRRYCRGASARGGWSICAWPRHIWHRSNLAWRCDCVGDRNGVGALFAFVVFMERSQRRVLVQYPRRQVGQRMTQG